MIGHLTFGDYDFGELFYCHAQRPLLPDVSVTERSVPVKHGSDFLRLRVEPVDIPATMVLRKPKGDHERMNAIMHEVVEHLYSTEPKKLYLPDDHDRYYMATVAGSSSATEFTTTARLEVVFRAFKPFRYGEGRSKAMAAGTNASIDPGGNFPTFPTVRAKATAGATYFRARNTTTGQRVVLYPNKRSEAESWKGTEQIVIDMENGVSYVNGSVWPTGLQSEYWAIDGKSTILFTGGSGTLEWSEAWL